ncbi:HTH-type transcriptional regulator RafR [Roseivivax jejudonensis]|uniref:HTH-type transcriptional regulator RafR n=1 Tax=Roseivivax jejudonensis TaxID=1529041 RepID=A0A1X6Z1J7_9RHOB|nr:substrate-binding domain-containing protein [Roseivivax jejudonensis]SLN37737.1 HTH-type transcriptional regulator RafR [Roseivivax jejudonensis]
MNLKELAEHLGLSPTTVSRALNGYPEVKETTRARVEAAARRYNYTPNAWAKGLATGRAMSIGHVMPVSKMHEMVNPVFGDFITGASEAYVEAGYDLKLTLVGDDDETARYRALSAKGNVDGIIVHGPHLTDRRIDLLRELGLPFVVHGRASEMPADYAWIDMNNRRAFDRATELLIELGHRRIALVNGLEHMDFAHRRRDGFLAALERGGIDADPALMRAGEMTEGLGFRAASDMLARPYPPTAFLASSMVTAMGIWRALAARGLTMGRDVSVITHDDDLGYLRNGEDVPIFTATRSSVRAAGRTAAEMLLRMIGDPGCAPLQTLMEAELILGQSTGPAPRPR